MQQLSDYPSMVIVITSVLLALVVILPPCNKNSPNWRQTTYYTKYKSDKHAVYSATETTHLGGQSERLLRHSGSIGQ